MNEFTKGEVYFQEEIVRDAMAGTRTHRWQVYRKDGQFAHLAEFKSEEDARLFVIAHTTATRLAALGYDAMDAMGKVDGLVDYATTRATEITSKLEYLKRSFANNEFHYAEIERLEQELFDLTAALPRRADAGAEQEPR